MTNRNAEIIKRIIARNADEKKALIERRSRLQETGVSMAETIISAFPEVERVWGFGSTYETWRNFRIDSDIDLAVEHGDLLKIYALVEREAPEGTKVDLLDMESADAFFVEMIKKNGTVLAVSDKGKR